ncbi:MAG: hypothetical protein RIS75_1345, partial [Actinomycetota bacterium]
ARLFKTKVPVVELMNMRFVALLEVVETLILGPLMRVESGSVLGDLLGTLFTYCVARLLVRLTPRSWQSLTASRAVLIWIGYFAISLVAVRTALSSLLPSIFGNEFLAAHLAFRLVFVLGFVGIGIIKHLDSIADQELRATVEGLEQLVSRLRREVNTQRKELSWVLHGPVQSALISTAVELEMARKSGKPLVGFAQRMEEVVSSIGTGYTRSPDLDVLISEMKDVWGHSIVFDTSISQAARSHLKRDFALASSVVEFVREGVANAFRHAAAQNVTIRIFTHSDVMLNIEIINDGRPLEPSRKHGLGSSIFDEICWRWSINSLPDKTTKLTASMPCATTIPSAI